jgi:hypothetical protein
MSNIFNNFLSGVFGTDGYMKDFAHASRLYRDDNLYDLAPKAGWMYYIRLGINPAIRSRIELVAPGWAGRYQPFVGILAKSADLPKFNISTETVNQYNRKRVIQTKLTYSPISITFHDDMANATTDLWKAYYRYYYADGNVITTGGNKNSKSSDAFANNKYLDSKSYAYGLANGQTVPFFQSIEIYLLNKKKFTSVTLLNPLIKEWGHSGVDQSQGNKMMDNKMTVEYEAVIYNNGPATQVGVNDNHYDRSPSPLSIGGMGSNTLFGPGGVIAGSAQVFGDISNVNKDTSFMDIVGIGIKAANLAKNVSKLTAAGIRQEGYSILTGQIAAIGQAGRTGDSLNYQGPVIGGVEISPNAVVNNFRQYYNSSVNNNIQATAIDLGPATARTSAMTNAQLATAIRER